MTRADTAWLARQGYRAADDPPSYQEVPEAERPWSRQLAAAAWARFTSLVSWYPYTSNVLMLAEVDRLHATPPKYPPDQEGPGYPTGGIGGSTRPYMRLAGPASILTGYWLPIDPTHTPTIASDPAYSLTDVTPYECVATFALPREETADARGFTVSGQAVTVPEGESRVDPFLARFLAEGLARSAETAFFVGAGSDLDPVSGLAGQAGIRTQAYTGAIYDDLVAAVATLRNARRFPNAIAVSVTAEKALRTLKDGAGRLVFDPTRPITISNLPVFASTGITSGSSAGFAIVADFGMVGVIWRVQANGQLIKVDRSDHVLFSSDQRRYRAAARWNLGLVPGAGPDSVLKLTGVPF